MIKKRKIAVHVNEEKLFDEKWIEYINSYEGYEAYPVNMKDSDILDKISECDGIMWHYLHSPLDKQAASAILTALELGQGKKVWPNYSTRWFFDEKVSQHFFLKSIGVPCVPSWVFWSYNEAESFLKQTEEYPLVFKLSVGAGAANVVKIDNLQEGLIYLKRMFLEGIYPYTLNEYKEDYPLVGKRVIQAIQYIMKTKRPQTPWYYQLQKNYFYVQKFIPGNKHDIRITVIGNRAFGFIRCNRDGDFRASGSGEIDWNPNSIPVAAIEIAFYVSQKFKFQSMAYDFLLDEEGKPVINEMSYGYLDEAVFKCPGHWDQDLIWHEGNMWPEQAHIEDFVKEME